MSALINKLKIVGRTKISFRFLFVVTILLFAIPRIYFYFFKFSLVLTGNKDNPSFLLSKNYSIPEENISFKFPYNFKIREYRDTNIDTNDHSEQHVYDFLENNSLKGIYIRTEIFINSGIKVTHADDYSNFLPIKLKNKADYFYNCSAPVGVNTCNAQSTITLPGGGDKILYINCNNYGKDNLCNVILPQILSSLEFE